MSILRDAGGVWPYRYPVTAWNLSTTGPKDITFTVPTNLGSFWDVIDSSAHELRVTAEDGVTALVYQRASFNLATRQLTIEVQGAGVQAATAKHIWLYWGQDSASDGAGSFSASSPLTGEMTNLEPEAPTIAMQSERPGATAPSQSVAKTVDETQDVWWSVGGVLSSTAQADGGYTAAEEIDAIKFGVYAAGTIQTGMQDLDKIAVVQMQDRTFVRTRWKAGSAGSYTLRLTLITSTGRSVQTRAVGYVTDLQEP